MAVHRRPPRGSVASVGHSIRALVLADEAHHRIRPAVDMQPLAVAHAVAVGCDVDHVAEPFGSGTRSADCSSVITIRRSCGSLLTAVTAAPSCVLPMRIAVWIASRSAMPVRGGTSTQLSLKANTRTDSHTPRATIAMPAAASERVMSDLRESRADIEPELSTSTM